MLLRLLFPVISARFGRGISLLLGVLLFSGALARADEKFLSPADLRGYLFKENLDHPHVFDTLEKLKGAEKLSPEYEEVLTDYARSLTTGKVNARYAEEAVEVLQRKVGEISGLRSIIAAVEFHRLVRHGVEKRGVEVSRAEGEVYALFEKELAAKPLLTEWVLKQGRLLREKPSQKIDFSPARAQLRSFLLAEAGNPKLGSSNLSAVIAAIHALGLGGEDAAKALLHQLHRRGTDQAQRALKFLLGVSIIPDHHGFSTGTVFSADRPAYLEIPEVQKALASLGDTEWNHLEGFFTRENFDFDLVTRLARVENKTRHINVLLAKALRSPDERVKRIAIAYLKQIPEMDQEVRYLTEVSWGDRRTADAFRSLWPEALRERYPQITAETLADPRRLSELFTHLRNDRPGFQYLMGELEAYAKRNFLSTEQRALVGEELRNVILAAIGEKGRDRGAIITSDALASLERLKIWPDGMEKVLLEVLELPWGWHNSMADSVPLVQSAFRALRERHAKVPLVKEDIDKFAELTRHRGGIDIATQGVPSNYALAIHGVEGVHTAWLDFLLSNSSNPAAEDAIHEIWAGISRRTDRNMYRPLTLAQIQDYLEKISRGKFSAKFHRFFMIGIERADDPILRRAVLEYAPELLVKFEINPKMSLFDEVDTLLSEGREALHIHLEARPNNLPTAKAGLDDFLMMLQLDSFEHDRKKVFLPLDPRARSRVLAAMEGVLQRMNSGAGQAAVSPDVAARGAAFAKKYGLSTASPTRIVAGDPPMRKVDAAVPGEVANDNACLKGYEKILSSIRARLR